MRTIRVNNFARLNHDHLLIRLLKRLAYRAGCLSAASFLFLNAPCYASFSGQGSDAYGLVRTQAPVSTDRAKQSYEAPHKKLAIVIDDFGNDMEGTSEILAMPVKLTIAVMPFLRTTERDARLAHERGFDVLVHLPMEPNQGKPEWLGPGAIMSSLSDSEIRQRVEQAIDNVPYAVGINNHMGSKITADPRIMSIILDVCRERGLFFLDSRTNYRTIVGKLCREKGMPDIGNQFFLDDQYNLPHISSQMNKVIAWMKEHDSCVIIGHVGVPGTKTASVIRSSIGKMGPEVEYVTLSQFVRQQNGEELFRGMLP
ncbi:divergent polysaccharide deacetylase family protein [Paenibacillus pinistramenti]|uniref:divergent polysaccharide deacetylase family protein n=1 Tax=Paenibacillus pinistramenti TaxID=1768003 RepID=UPI0011095187|nr:divergent polysaccharide deacetylase family protein [Paenibacillus pinistramenti]